MTARTASAISHAMTETRANIAPKERIFVALDAPEVARTAHLAQALRGAVGAVEIGKEPFSAQGPDGAVCGPQEIATLRADCGPDFDLVVPGIRPSRARAEDRKRAMSPAEAFSAGADCLVVGRPITAQPDPLGAARRIVAELAETAETRA